MIDKLEAIELRPEQTDNWLQDLIMELDYLRSSSPPADVSAEVEETARIVREARRERIEMQILNTLLPVFKEVREGVVSKVLESEEIIEFLRGLNLKKTIEGRPSQSDIPVASTAHDSSSLEPTLIEQILPPFHVIYETAGNKRPVRVAFLPNVLDEHDLLFGIGSGSDKLSWVRLSDYKTDIEEDTRVVRDNHGFHGVLKNPEGSENVYITLLHITDQSPVNYLRMHVGLSRNPHDEKSLLIVDMPNCDRTRIKIAPKGSADGIKI